MAPQINELNKYSSGTYCEPVTVSGTEDTARKMEGTGLHAASVSVEKINKK